MVTADFFLPADSSPDGVTNSGCFAARAGRQVSFSQKTQPDAPKGVPAASEWKNVRGWLSGPGIPGCGRPDIPGQGNVAAGLEGSFSPRSQSHRHEAGGKHRINAPVHEGVKQVIHELEIVPSQVCLNPVPGLLQSGFSISADWGEVLFEKVWAGATRIPAEAAMFVFSQSRRVIGIIRI